MHLWATSKRSVSIDLAPLRADDAQCDVSLTPAALGSPWQNGFAERLIGSITTHGASMAFAVARRASYAAAKRERCSSKTNSAQECLLRSLALDPSSICPTPQLTGEWSLGPEFAWIPANLSDLSKG
jgi:hypothetical protein